MNQCPNCATKTKYDPTKIFGYTSKILEELTDLPYISDSLYRDISYMIKKTRDGRKSSKQHETVKTYDPRTRRWYNIDKNISELLQNMWYAGIRTSLSCEDNVPKTYIWISFPADSDLRKFLNIVFLGDSHDIPTFNRALGGSEDYENTWRYTTVQYVEMSNTDSSSDLTDTESVESISDPDYPDTDYSDTDYSAFTYPDTDHSEFNQTESTQSDSNQSDSNQTGSTQSDSDQTGSNQSDSNQTGSTQSDSDQSDSEHSDSTHTDTNHSDTNHSDTDQSELDGQHYAESIELSHSVRFPSMDYEYVLEKLIQYNTQTNPKWEHSYLDRHLYIDPNNRIKKNK